MRKIFNIAIVLAVFAQVSCERELETEGISEIVYYPRIELAGEPLVVVMEGEEFTDLGAEAFLNDEPVEVTVNSNVNTAEAGIYNVTYSATNPEGYSREVARTVIVSPGEEPGVDISGSYQNVGSFNYTATMTKLGPGAYVISNIWGGASAAVIPSYLFTSDGVNITLPLNQLSPYGRVTGTGTISSSGLLKAAVTLLDQGPFTSNKSWQKI